MKDHNPHDPLNMIGEAYERLTEIAMRNLHIQDGLKKSKLILASSNRRPQSELDSLLMDPKKLSHSPYHQDFLKLLFTNILRNAADKTIVNLNYFQKCKKLCDEFHTEELVDANTYYCDHCGWPNEIELPSFLEKCQNCGHKTFRLLH